MSPTLASATPVAVHRQQRQLPLHRAPCIVSSASLRDTGRRASSVAPASATPDAVHRQQRQPPRHRTPCIANSASLRYTERRASSAAPASATLIALFHLAMPASANIVSCRNDTFRDVDCIASQLQCQSPRDTLQGASCSSECLAPYYALPELYNEYKMLIYEYNMLVICMAYINLCICILACSVRA